MRHRGLLALLLLLACMGLAAQDGAGGAWIPVRGAAADLAIGSDGTVVAIDLEGRGWRRAPGRDWTRLPGDGRLARIDAGPPGVVWALDAEGRARRLVGSLWVVIGPLRAVDIGVGPLGSVYVVDAKDRAIHRFDEAAGAFEKVENSPLGASRVDADERGLPWAIVGGSLFAHDGLGWQAQNVTGIDLSIGPGGDVALVGVDGVLRVRSPGAAPPEASVWRPAAPHAVAAVAAGPERVLWTADSEGRLWANSVLRNRVEGARTGGPSPFADLVRWRSVRSGGAKDLAIGARGDVLLVDLEGRVWRRSGVQDWSRVASGVMERVAVSPRGIAWGIDGEGRILRHAGIQWAVVPGEAREIAIGATNGPVWILRPDGVPARLDPAGSEWMPVPGVNARRLAVAPSGEAWVIDVEGSVKRHDGSAWVGLPAVAARDIAIGPQGAVYVLTDEGLRRLVTGPAGWQRVIPRVSATRVAVGPGDAPWVVLEGGQLQATNLFEREAAEARQPPPPIAGPAIASPRIGDGTFAASPALPSSVRTQVRPTPFSRITVPVAARQVAIGREGSVFALSSEGQVLRWSNREGRFNAFPGNLLRLAVDGRGNPWGLTTKGEAFRFDGENWRFVPDFIGEDIAVGGADGSTVFATDAGNAVYRYSPGEDRFRRFTFEGDIPAPQGRRVAVDPGGRPWLLQDPDTPQSQLFRCDTQPCVRVQTSPALPALREVRIGPEGTILLADRLGRLLRLDPRRNTWAEVPTPRTDTRQVQGLSVGPDGYPWITLSGSNEVWYTKLFERDESRDRGTALATQTGTTTERTATGTSPATVTFSFNMQFDPIPLASGGSAINLFVSAANLVVAVDTLGLVSFYDAKTRRFVTQTALAPPVPFVRLAVERDGALWGVDGFNRLYRREGSAYVRYDTQLPSSPTPSFLGIGIGADGTLLVTTQDNSLYRFDFANRRFARNDYQFAGSDNQLSVGPDGRPWIIDAANDLYEFTGTEFVRRLQNVADVYVGPGGAVFAADASGRIQRWNAAGRAWDRIQNVAGATNVAVDADGRLWYTNGVGVVFRQR